MHFFENYKGFKQASLDLFSPFTLLIGPNGSGKTNLIEGLELLAFVAHGGPIYEVVEVGRGSIGLPVRGGIQGCARNGSESFSIGMDAAFEPRGVPFTYSITIRTSPQPRVAKESLFVDGKLIFESLDSNEMTASSDIRVRYNNFARGGKTPQVSLSAQKSVLSQFGPIASGLKKNGSNVMGWTFDLQTYLKASFVFDPNPKSMRDYSRVGNNVLLRDGSNLSAVLYHLREERDPALERLLERIRQLPDEPFGAFDFERTNLGDVMFSLQEEDGYMIDARRLSDGTLRTLAILTALETADPGSRVIVEEFDNGLHPSRVRILLEAIRDCCERRELNVLATTHNPATLNELAPDQLESLVLCAGRKDSKSSDLIRFTDIPKSIELLERGRLGDLVTKRLLEEHLMPGFVEKRTGNVLNWLESLKS